MALIERTVTDVKWDKPGVAVKGHLIQMRQVEFEGKRNIGYTVINRSGIFRFFGTAELNAKLFPADLGAMIQVEMTAEEDRGNSRTLKHFRVCTDPDDRIAPAAVLGSSQRPPANGPQPDPGLEITDDDIPF